MLQGTGSPFSCAVCRAQMDGNSPAVLLVTTSPQSPTLMEYASPNEKGLHILVCDPS